MDVFDAIALRRSVKPLAMKPDPVDRRSIEAMLEAGNWAPSHRHTEPWRFIVFEGDARVRLAEQVVTNMTDDRAPPIPDDDPRRVNVIAKMTAPPVVVAIVCQTSTLPKVIEHEELISTGIAVHNMHLAARAMGLGAFWTSGAKAFHPKMAEFLGIEPPARCLGFLYVGYPKDQWPASPRGAVADKVHWRS